MDTEGRYIETPPVETRGKEKKPRLLQVVEKRGRGILSTTKFEYGAAGRVVMQERVYSGGETIAGKITRIYGYDGKGRETQVSNYLDRTARVRGVSETVHHEGVLDRTYLGETNLVQMESYGRDGSTTYMVEYEYDDQGRKISAKTTNFGPSYFSSSPGPRESLVSFKYDEQGRLIEEIRSDPDERPIKYNYKYDINGRLAQEDRGFVDSKEPFGSVITTYDDDGLTVKKENYYGGGLVWSQTSKKDKNGNLVSYEFHDKDRNYNDAMTYENKYE